MSDEKPYIPPQYEQALDRIRARIALHLTKNLRLFEPVIDLQCVSPERLAATAIVLLDSQCCAVVGGEMRMPQRAWPYAHPMAEHSNCIETKGERSEEAAALLLIDAIRNPLTTHETPITL